MFFLGSERWQKQHREKERNSDLGRGGFHSFGIDSCSKRALDVWISQIRFYGSMARFYNDHDQVREACASSWGCNPTFKMAGK